MKHLWFRTYLISILFIVIIAFPFVNDRLHFIHDVPSLENRKLAEEPKFDINRLDPFPAAFEKYYTDTFALRSRIINFFNAYNCILLKKSPFPDKVIIGRHNWLYLSGNDINCYLGKEPFTDQELQTLKEEFERRRDYLASQHCKFYIMITPGKANVYPENVPYTFSRMSQQSWGEQLIAYMKQHSTVPMIDLFSAYRNIRSSTKEDLYYSLDNHWNYLGAFYAANVAIADMSKDLPNLEQLKLSDFEVTKKPYEVGNMKKMLGNLDIYQDTEYELKPLKGFKAVDAPKQNYPVPEQFPYPWEYEFDKEIKGSEKPGLLIFCDSFGGYIFPFLSEEFSRTVKIFGGWNYSVDKHIVEKEKPDAVLLMVQEPVIRNIFGNLTK